MRTRLSCIQGWETLAREARYRAGNLALLAKCCRRQLERHFKLSMKRTPQNWLDSLQMHEAKKLLKRDALIKEIAPKLGFPQGTNFCRKFKRLEGRTPKPRKTWK